MMSNNIQAAKPRLAILIIDMNWRGGTQRMATAMAELMSDTYEVTILTCEPISRSPAFKSVDVHYDSLNKARRGWGRLGTIRWMFDIALALRRYCKEHQVQAVCSMWYDIAIAMAVGLEGTGVKKIAWEHIEYNDAPKQWRFLRKLFYRRLDAIACLTDADQPKYHELNSNTFVVRNFVTDLGSRLQSTKQKKILCVGHFIWRKGYDRLFWEVAGALRKNPDWKLTIVGGGDLGIVDHSYYQYMVALIQSLKISDQVEVVPANNNIHEFYDVSSLFVMASRSEGLPMVLIEAKMAGLPIVAFDCPTGPAEIIRDNKDGFVIKEGTGHFGDRLALLMGDEQLREDMAVEARSDALARFSAHTVKEQWHKLLHST